MVGQCCVPESRLDHNALEKLCDAGLYVAGCVAGSPAEAHGALTTGLRITEINGADTRSLRHVHDVRKLIGADDAEIKLVVMDDEKKLWGAYRER